MNQNKKKDNCELVVKSNNLIEAKYNLTLNEQKILMHSVSKIDRNKEKFNLVQTEVRDFARLIGTTTDRYVEFRELVKSLRSKELIFINEEGKEIITGWLSSISYEGDGVIELEFSEKLAPELLKLREKFTKYQLQNILYMKNKHSIRIYELLKQYEKIGKRKFEYFELRNLLGLKNEYKRKHDFEKKVIEPAKKEINAQTDITIDYTKIRKGRSIIGYNFTIERTVLEDEEYIDYLNEYYDIDDLKKRMGIEDENFNSKQVMDIFEAATEKVNENEIDVFEYIRINYNHIKDKARNTYAYLLKAIKNDYACAADQIKFDMEI